MIVPTSLVLINHLIHKGRAVPPRLVIWAGDTSYISLALADVVDPNLPQRYHEGIEPRFKAQCFKLTKGSARKKAFTSLVTVSAWDLCTTQDDEVDPIPDCVIV